MTWDSAWMSSYFNTLNVEVPQSKTSKTKVWSMIAGRSRHLCAILAMGDHFIMQSVPPMYYAGQVTWIFPDLIQLKCPGTKIGDYLKALMVGDQGAAKYKDHRVASLPAGASAAGLRPGAVNMMAAAMPLEFAVHITGHEAKGGAFFEYLDASVSNGMPGAVVLSGWSPFPWGRSGKGPVPADLLALQEGAGINIESLTTVICVLFQIDDQSPPMFKKGGKLWDFVLWMFATQLMYYRERIDTLKIGEKKGEMKAVLIKIEEVMAHKDGYDLGANTRATLLRWSDIISDKFRLDNLSIMEQQGHGQNTQMVTAMQSIAQTVGAVGLSLHRFTSKVDENFQKVSERLDSIEGTIRSMQVGASKEVPIEVDAFSPEGERGSTSSSRSAAHQANAALRDLPPDEHSDEADEEDMYCAAKETEKEQAAEASKVASYGGIMGGAQEIFELNKYAAMAYLEHMHKRRVHHPTIKAGDKGRLNRITLLFDAMATEEEQQKLLGNRAGKTFQAELGIRRTIATTLANLVKAKLQDIFRDKFAGGVRDTLKPGSDLKSSQIENNEKVLKKASIPLLDEKHLLQWRKTNEARVLEEEQLVRQSANHTPAGSKRKQC